MVLFFKHSYVIIRDADAGAHLEITEPPGLTKPVYHPVTYAEPPGNISDGIIDFGVIHWIPRMALIRLRVSN